LPDIDNLQFVRIYNFCLIPRSLFESAKDMDAAKIDRIYRFGQLFTTSPLTLLYVLIDISNKIKGVLWADIDAIDAIIFVKFFALDKEYQTPVPMLRSRILEKTRDFLFSLPTGPDLKKEIHFLTLNPGVPSEYEKLGIRRSKHILLEVTNEINGQDNHGNPKRHDVSNADKPVKQPEI